MVIEPGAVNKITIDIRTKVKRALTIWAKNHLLPAMDRVTPERHGYLMASNFVRRERMTVVFGFEETPDTIASSKREKSWPSGFFYGWYLHDIVTFKPGPISSVKGAIMHKWLPVAFETARPELKQELRSALRLRLASEEPEIEEFENE